MVLSIDTLRSFRNLDLANLYMPGSVVEHSLAPTVETSIKKGAMPDFRESSSVESRRSSTLSGKNKIYIDPLLESSQIGLVGFDIRIGNLIAKSDTVMDNVTEEDLMNMPHKRLGQEEEYVFDPNPDGENVYYVVSLEQINLSSDLEMLIDSKSTTGRIGCMSHLAGKTEDGKLITIVQPFSFPIKVRSGKSRLSQVVIRYKNSSYMTNEEILEGEDVKFHGGDIDSLLNSQGFLMKFDTKCVYKARSFYKDMKPIDIDKKGLEWQDYFELEQGNSKIYADKKTLYLLGSQGVIELGPVCGLLSREQGVLTGTGAWSHLAGIFQPFFKGGITMEFYSHEKRRIIDGSGAGYVKFDRIEGKVENPGGGNYQNQKPPQLAKMFKQN